MNQEEALDILKLGGNVFLTGAAGSGKTYLLNKYIKYLHEHGVNIAITASTGIAATHIGGQTIHSWSGIGVRDRLSEDDLETLARRSKLKRSVQSTSVLIIDEVSMLHARQLNMVDQITSYLRESEVPFGGLQVVLCGDFFQLPPVSRSRSSSTFAFDSIAWGAGNFQICYLHEQHRQTQDPLLDVLNDIRSGRAGEDTRIPLRTRYKKEPVGSTEGIRPTTLYARNVSVDSLNDQELQKLPGEEVTFQMTSKGFKKQVEALMKTCLAPEELRLKKDSQVLFVKNALDGSYVNGTRGVVEAFDDSDGWPLVRTTSGALITAHPDEWRYEENDVITASVSQVPLRLAWAITVHKSQGMTLDVAEMDLSDTFEPGMGYVALSRVRTLEGLKIMGLNEMALRVSPKVLARDKVFQELSEIAGSKFNEHSPEEKTKLQEAVLYTRFGGLKDKSLVQRTKKDAQKKRKTPTHEITLEMLQRKMSLEDIASERALTVGTIIDHLEKLKGLGLLPCVNHLRENLDEEDFSRISAEFEKSEDGKLGPVFAAFNGSYEFDTLKLVRLFAA